MGYNVCKLIACNYNELPSNTPVINRNEVEYVTWIKIPADFGRDFILYEVNEIVPENKEVEFLNVIEQQCCKPWLKATSSELNLEPGHHVYKISFVNRFTNDTSSLYFSYIIQDDDPDKPYVYMDRD